MEYWKIILPAVVALSSFAAEPVITCEPRELRGVPGEPLRLEITVEADRAAPVQLQIPAVSNLFLRTVEKIPIQRTETGHYIQKRVIIWQGLEAGSTTLTNLTVVFQTLENVDAVSSPRFQGLEKKAPTIGIVIDKIEPAKPPKNPPRPAATPPQEGITNTSVENPLLWRGVGTAGWVLRFPEAAI